MSDKLTVTVVGGSGENLEVVLPRSVAAVTVHCTPATEVEAGFAPTTDARPFWGVVGGTGSDGWYLEPSYRPGAEEDYGRGASGDVPPAGGETRVVGKEALVTAVGSIRRRGGPVFVDVQCPYTGDAVYAITEFAMACEGVAVASVVPKPRSDGGDLSVEELTTIVADVLRHRKVYVKGLQKADVLVRALRVRDADIETLDSLPKLTDLRKKYGPAPCPAHARGGSPRCAGENVALLMRAYREDAGAARGTSVR